MLVCVRNLVENPEDRISGVAAHLIQNIFMS